VRLADAARPAMRLPAGLPPGRAGCWLGWGCGLAPARAGGHSYRGLAPGFGRLQPSVTGSIPLGLGLSTSFLASGLVEARARARMATSADAAPSLEASSSFLFPHPAGVDAWRCASPTVAGESEYGSAWCGGGHHLSLSMHGLLPVRASPRRGRVRERLRKAWRRPAPSLSSSGRGHLSMRASHRRGRVRERLRTVWRQPASPTSLRPGVDACRCAPPTVAGESVWLRVVWRWPATSLSPSRRGRLPVRASHQCGRVREWLHKVWRRPATSFSLSRRGRLPVRPSHRRGRVQKRLRAVWGGRHHPPPFVQSWTLAGARLPTSRASPGTASHGVGATGTPSVAVQLPLGRRLR
jgi:hypothetical protein